MLSILLFAFISFYYYYSIAKSVYSYCWTRLSGHTSYSFTLSACVTVAFWNLNPQLKFVIPSIALFSPRSGFVHLFNYLLFGILNRSAALDFMFVVAEVRTFLEISSVMLVISLIMLALCWHYALCFPATIMPKLMPA